MIRSIRLRKDRFPNTQLFPPLIYSVLEVCSTITSWRGLPSEFATVGPSSSHTVGPMRAGKIFITDLKELGLLEKVSEPPNVLELDILTLEIG